MNTHRVQCPRCGRGMVISDRAPAQITCPSCLTRIDVATAIQPPPVPMRVIPLEYEVARDIRKSRAGMIALGVIVSVGFVLMWLPGMLREPVRIVMLAVPVVCVVLVAMASASKHGMDPRDRQQVIRETAKSSFYWIGRIAAVFLTIIGVLLLVLVAVCGVMIAKI